MSLTWQTELPERISNQGCLFLEDAWLQACAAHFSGQLHVLSGEEGCVPFELVNQSVRKVPAKVLRVLGDPLADQFFLRSTTDIGWPQLIGAMEKAPACDMIVLSEIDASEADRTLITRLTLEAGLRAVWRQCGNAPVVPLARDGTTLATTDYSSTLRNRLKRGRKKMNAAGDMQVNHHLPKPDEVDALLDTLKSIEDDSWKGEEDTGLFQDSRMGFVRDLSHRLAALGQLEIYVMTLDGTPISYRYGFRHQGRFLDYNLAYRQDFHALSPGRILLDEIVQTAAREGLDAVDASRGSLIRPHILADWPGGVRPHYRLTLYRPTVRGRLLHFIETNARPALRSLKARFSRT